MPAFTEQSLVHSLDFNLLHISKQSAQHPVSRSRKQQATHFFLPEKHIPAIVSFPPWPFSPVPVLLWESPRKRGENIQELKEARGSVSPGRILASYCLLGPLCLIMEEEEPRRVPAHVTSGSQPLCGAALILEAMPGPLRKLNQRSLPPGSVLLAECKVNTH